MTFICLSGAVSCSDGSRIAPRVAVNEDADGSDLFGDLPAEDEPAGLNGLQVCSGMAGATPIRTTNGTTTVAGFSATATTASVMGVGVGTDPSWSEYSCPDLNFSGVVTKRDQWETSFVIDDELTCIGPTGRTLYVGIHSAWDFDGELSFDVTVRSLPEEQWWQREYDDPQLVEIRCDFSVD